MRIVSIDPQGTKTHNFHRQSIELGISNLNWNRPTNSKAKKIKNVQKPPGEKGRTIRKSKMLLGPQIEIFIF